MQFVDLVGCENMVAAISSEKQLYTWGKASKGALGLYNAKNEPLEEVNIPTKVQGLDSYNVLNVSVGYNHMLILVEDKSNPNKRKVIAYGDNSKGQLGDKDANLNKFEVSFFNDKFPYLISAGYYCSFVCCGQKKKGIVHDSKCCVHGKEIRDILFMTKSKSAVYKFWCKSCLGTLPNVTIAIRNPITKIEEKNWPIIENLEIKENKDKKVECSMCLQQIKKAMYCSAVKEVPGVLCESCFFKTPNNFLPAIYYRFSSCLFEVKDLPLLSLYNLYETTNDYLSLIFSPHYKLQLPSVGIDKAIKPSLEEFLLESKQFGKEQDLDILEIINEFLVEKDKEIDKLSLKTDLQLNFSKKSTLSTISEDILKRRVKVIIKMNKIIQRAIQLIDFRAKSHGVQDLYVCYSKVKDYVALKTKDQITKQIITNSPKTKGKTEIVLDRHKAMNLRLSGMVDNTGERSMFGQMWRQMKEKATQFRKRPKQGKFPFKIKFRAEGGVDAGGLFRDAVDSICEELQTLSLPLLIPTPNNKTAYGEYREKWTINPSARQTTHLEMYEFFGAFLGMSFRLNHILPLNLPRLFWKELLNDPADTTDLKQIDTFCVQCLEDIANIEKKGVNTNSFTSVIDTCFVTRLSDGTEKELKKGGRDIRVTFENRQEYVNLVEEIRLAEGQLQMKSIKIGMYKIVPQSLVKLYSSRELELKICGKPTFKVEALKKITRYSVTNFMV